MRITIVGAGPVGLLLACLLAGQHRVMVLDKRIQHVRNHPLSLSAETIQMILDYLTPGGNVELIQLLRSWQGGGSVNTATIQAALLVIAERMGVRVVLGVAVNSLSEIGDRIVIGADGARSTIRRLAFGEVVDQHTISHLVQFKFITSGRTHPRPLATTMGHCFLNGITGDDIVLNFESMPPSNDELRKSATLHIPIPKSVYDILSVDGKGTFANPWTLEEITQINAYSHPGAPALAKLIRVLRRYKFGVSWRGGWVEDAKLTALPLTIFRSPNVFTLTPDKLVLLVGDASSSLVYERGLAKGWREVVKLASILNHLQLPTFHSELVGYNTYCRTLYESERDQALRKGRKIADINTTTSVGSKLATLSLGTIFSGLLIGSSMKRIQQ